MGERVGVLVLTSWAGTWRQPVLVCGETRARYFVAAPSRLQLAGRRRFAAPGEIVLVPKRAVTLKLRAVDFQLWQAALDQLRVTRLRQNHSG